MPRVPTEAVPRKIIRSASETYREIGYERAGMSTIARRLGMKAPALYWYFHSKEEVLVTLLEQTIADLLQFVHSLLHSTEPRQRLWEFIYAYVLWQLRQQRLSAPQKCIYTLSQLRNNLPPEKCQGVKSLERELFGICRDLVRQVHGKSQRSSEVAPFAFSLIGMIEHINTWFRPDGALSDKQMATLYADLTLSIHVVRLRANAPAG